MKYYFVTDIYAWELKILIAKYIHTVFRNNKQDIDVTHVFQ